jgi:citrate synthase
MKRKHLEVQRRNEDFAERTATRIWYEKPTDYNPYLAEEWRCHGYDIFELLEKCSFIDVLYLLFRGQLPRPEHKALLEAIMIAFVNPGPRHPATRAAMTVAVSKTDVAHILPISLSILGGKYLGAGEIEETMRFLRKSSQQDAADVATKMISEMQPPKKGDCQVAPGFGSYFSGIDVMPKRIADKLSGLSDGNKVLSWGQEFAKTLEPHGQGWLYTGVAAAAICDLGFQPRAGTGLLQLICSPGLLAHGIEMANKPTTAMPSVDDQHYVIES